MKIEQIYNQLLQELKKSNSEFNIKLISDGHHTFDDLYDFRLVYNCLLFNEWGKQKKFPNHPTDDTPLYDVHKSWKHNDGEYCFGRKKKHFKVAAMLPDGEVSNHYKAEHWDKFKIPEKEKISFEFDNHSDKDVLERLLNLL